MDAAVGGRSSGETVGPGFSINQRRVYRFENFKSATPAPFSIRRCRGLPTLTPRPQYRASRGRLHTSSGRGRCGHAGGPDCKTSRMTRRSHTDDYRLAHRQRYFLCIDGQEQPMCAQRRLYVDNGAQWMRVSSMLEWQTFHAAAPLHVWLLVH